MPQRAPISPQCRMKRSAAGVSVLSDISVNTEITAMAGGCQGHIINRRMKANKCRCLLAVWSAAWCCAQPLPDTQPLNLTGDPVQQMVSGIGAWLSRETTASAARRRPSRERLRYILGTVDERAAFEAPELVKLSETADYTVYSARWPVLDGVTAEGLLYQPKRDSGVRLVAVPDADQAPDDVEIARSRCAAG